MSIDTWNPNSLLDLPYSERVDVPVLKRIFKSRAASYKYLFFLSLLDILMEDGFQTASIPLERIRLEMLLKSWYPHQFFKLSFGVSDQIPNSLNRLKLPFSENATLFTTNGRKELKQAIHASDYTNNSLLDMVQYRLLTPFFEEKLRGQKDAAKNRMIAELAFENRMAPRTSFYFFTADLKTLIMNHDWMLYFYENFNLVRSFARFEWLDYMQRRNPSVPNLMLKLYPPMARESLQSQTKFWKHVLDHSSMNCLFSGEPITKDDLSLDHFLPWSFIAHDQLWNLLPVSRSINSSKLNRLPSFSKYLDGFVDRQYQGLSVYYETTSRQSWKKIIEPYQTDLHLTENEILNKDSLGRHLRQTLNPLCGLAEAQGFSPNWVYKS